MYYFLAYLPPHPLPTCLPTDRPTYLPTYLPTYQVHCISDAKLLKFETMNLQTNPVRNYTSTPLNSKL